MSTGSTSSGLEGVAKRCNSSLPARVLRYRAADGTVLDGAILGSGPVGVVVANSAGLDLCEWLHGDDKFVRSLIASDHRVLLFDYRGTGLSAYPSGAAAQRFDADVAAGAALLRRLGARRVVLVGGSLGGIIVLAAARHITPPPSAIISLSGSGFAGTNTGPAYGNLDGRSAVKRLHVPLQFIVAKGDTDALPDARALHAAAASHDKHLIVVPGTAHSSFLLRDDSNSQSAAQLREVVTRFIRQHTGG